ncbi:MAG: squalene--hopene cyclase [Chloroflexi bacterium]|nr:squalene--hopene cyclase [Chloroflexota bacterium]
MDNLSNNNLHEQRAYLDKTIRMSHDYLLGIQYPDGYWWGELESNPTMEAEFILMNYFLGIKDEGRNRKLVNHILGQQRDDGTWGQYYGAPGDLSTSAECYFALKLSGVPPDGPQMLKARDFILSKGGVPNTRVFTKIWFSLFGQWDWKGVPVMPPELMLIPDWFPLNLYDFSSWARATIVPLLVLMDRKPVRRIPDWAAVDELYVLSREDSDYSVKRPSKLIGWDALFYANDTVLRQLERLPWIPTRGQAVRRAEQWVVDHQEDDGSWGGIQPPWVYSLMCLYELGYGLDHPAMKKGLEGFESFVIEEDDTMRVQACVSPLWDTCLTMIALVDSGVRPDHPALAKAGRFLVKKQVRNGGDWQVRAKGAPPGGWAFEFANDSYPDLDDTAEVVMALSKIDLQADEGAKQEAIDRALRWLMGMQSSNGGWASFDKDNSKGLIAKIPFLDFGETIDPPSVDVTAHILEMLGQLGVSADHPSVQRALAFVMDEQEHDGAWFGRWGVNYIYGIGSVLPALEALGIDMNQAFIHRAVRWVVEHQNEDGGWGESCSSYVDVASRGRGPSTASQTAWALMALIAAGEGGLPSTKKGVDYLLGTQDSDGTWDEPYFTGTGFPGYGIGQRLPDYLGPDDPGYQGDELSAGFMINYHMYRIYWPLTALGRYRRYLDGETQVIRHGSNARISYNIRVEKPRRKRLKQLIPMW